MIVAVSANWQSLLKFRADFRNHIAVSIKRRSFQKGLGAPVRGAWG